MDKENMSVENANEKVFSSVTVRDKAGKSYRLEFSRRVVESMERKGFKLDMDYPNTNIRELWRGAFQKNHRGMLPEKIDAIWEDQRKKDDLLGVLVKLYMKPLEDLMAEPDGDDENPTWETD